MSLTCALWVFLPLPRELEIVDIDPRDIDPTVVLHIGFSASARLSTQCTLLSIYNGRRRQVITCFMPDEKHRLSSQTRIVLAIY